MSKHENSLFPNFFTSYVNLPEWRLKETNVSLISFLRLFTETITPKKKAFFQNFKINIVKLTKFLERFSKKVDYNEEKLISGAEYESRNIPLTLTRSSY